MISFKTHLKEAKIYSIAPDGSKKINNINSINFTHSDLQKSRGYSEMIKTSDTFHNAYKKSGNYVSMTGKKDPYSNKKVRDLLSKNLNVEFPEVSVCEKGSIKFDNGSHRYSMMHRMKQENCVVMNSESCGNAKKHGYIS